MKKIVHFIKFVIVFSFVGLFMAQCSKADQRIINSSDYLIPKIGKKDGLFSNNEILEIAEMHNEYLAEMINWGVQDEESLIDYLQENFDEFKTISKDSLLNIINSISDFSKEDLINIILKNKTFFNNGYLLVNYLNQADKYLETFNEEILDSLAQKAANELLGIDWQIFYAYVMVLKKSKEFWIDLGNLIKINPHAQARDVVKADATAVAFGLMGLAVTGVLALCGVGIAIEIMAGATLGKTAFSLAVGGALSSGAAALH